MTLTLAQIAAREGKLTASRVGALMSGDSEKILALWEIVTGQRGEDDLSGVWPVQLGVATEALNLAWYERKTGHALSRHGEVVVCPRAEWAACTLDAFDAALTGPVEAKHVGGREPRERVVARYMPQVHWQMLCCGSQVAALSIIEGANEPTVETIAFDAAYADELWQRAEAFMRCVESLTPPVALAPVAAPVPQAEWRTVDMRESNSWAAYAATWLRFRSEARSFDGAAKELKALVGADVGLAHGHGVTCKRAKNGALTISEMK